MGIIEPCDIACLVSTLIGDGAAASKDKPTICPCDNLLHRCYATLT